MRAHRCPLLAKYSPPNGRGKCIQRLPVRYIFSSFSRDTLLA